MVNHPSEEPEYLRVFIAPAWPPEPAACFLECTPWGVSRGSTTGTEGPRWEPTRRHEYTHSSRSHSLQPLLVLDNPTGSKPPGARGLPSRRGDKAITAPSGFPATESRHGKPQFSTFLRSQRCASERKRLVSLLPGEARSREIRTVSKKWTRTVLIGWGDQGLPAGARG